MEEKYTSVCFKHKHSTSAFRSSSVENRLANLEKKMCDFALERHNHGPQEIIELRAKLLQHSEHVDANIARVRNEMSAGQLATQHELSDMKVTLYLHKSQLRGLNMFDVIMSGLAGGIKNLIRYKVKATNVNLQHSYYLANGKILIKFSSMYAANYDYDDTKLHFLSPIRALLIFSNKINVTLVTTQQPKLAIRLELVNIRG
uniref:Uncharacterized protein n=1 Tax=Glossina palpalis gambiensis TaxID=67801 RepID=A0A1B0C0K9_9MUSC